mmetsp:Transcript_4142/g.5203  ORF Transcript_4142/g.5203 Transcript_4142/m.5203 type:complete len:96 (-) Transcript_4142:1746-2033(-)
MEHLRVEREDVKLAKRLFYMGFLGLPLVWLLNLLTFQEKWRKGTVAEDARDFSVYIQGSLLGFLAAVVAVTAWVAVFQINPNAFESLWVVAVDDW